MLTFVGKMEKRRRHILINNSIITYNNGCLMSYIEES